MSLWAVWRGLPLSPLSYSLKEKGWWVQRGVTKKKNLILGQKKCVFTKYLRLSFAQNEAACNEPFQSAASPPVCFYFLPTLISLCALSISSAAPMNYPAIMRHFGILWGWRVTMLIAASQHVRASPHGSSLSRVGRGIRCLDIFHSIFNTISVQRKDTWSGIYCKMSSNHWRNSVYIVRCFWWLQPYKWF